MTPAGTSNELDVQNGWEENTQNTCNLIIGFPNNGNRLGQQYHNVLPTTSRISNLTRLINTLLHPRCWGGMAWSAGTRRWTLPGFVGGGDSFLFVYFIFYLYWYSYIRSIFCLWLSFRVWSDGLYFLFGGFPTLTCFLFFLNLLFLGTCIVCFSQVLDFLWVFFILFYFSVPYFGLACDHGISFLCLEE